jgi:hypothetical protein
MFTEFGRTGRTLGNHNERRITRACAIVGGRIQNQIKNISSTTRNVYFDGRFSNNGFAPPWFPSTTVAPGGASSATLTSSVQRVQWLNRSSYF